MVKLAFTINARPASQVLQRISDAIETPSPLLAGIIHEVQQRKIPIVLHVPEQAGRATRRGGGNAASLTQSEPQSPLARVRAAIQQGQKIQLRFELPDGEIVLMDNPMITPVKSSDGLSAELNQLIGQALKTKLGHIAGVNSNAG
ncbi:MAG: hypothetical protein AAF418_04845 [Pseudomonadota bacterium]